MTDQRIRIEVPANEWCTSNDRLHWREKARNINPIYNISGPEECANIPRGLTTTLDLGKEWL